MALFGRKKEKEEAGAPAAEPARERPARRDERPLTFLPRREGRKGVESLFMRLVATGGIVGIATAVAAIMGTQDLDAWIVGLAVSLLSVILAAVLWSSRSL